MMAPADKGALLQRMLFILGALVAFAGVGTTLTLSLADLFRGAQVNIGDAQLVAVIGGILLTGFGVFLVLTSLDIGVRKNLDRLTRVHSKFKPGKASTLWRIIWPAGTVVALLGMVLGGLSAGMDIIQGKDVSIGGYQEVIMLASLAIVFIGLMFMTLGTLQVALSYDPILMQLQAFKIMEPGETPTEGPAPARAMLSLQRAPETLPQSGPQYPYPMQGSQTPSDASSPTTLYYSPDRVELGLPAPFKGPTTDNAESSMAYTGPSMMPEADGFSAPATSPETAVVIANQSEHQEQVTAVAHTETTGTEEEAPVGEVTAELATVDTRDTGMEISFEGKKDAVAGEKRQPGALEWPTIGPSRERTDLGNGVGGSDEAAQPETGLVDTVIERSVLDDILKNISSTYIEEADGLPDFGMRKEEDGEAGDEGMEEMEVEQEVIEDRPATKGKDGGNQGTRTCPSCGQPIRSDWRMCPYCDQVLPL